MSYSNFRGEEFGKNMEYYPKKNINVAREKLNIADKICTGRYIYFFTPTNSEIVWYISRYDFLTDTETTFVNCPEYNQDSTSFVAFNEDKALVKYSNEIAYIVNLKTGTQSQITIDVSRIDLQGFLGYDENSAFFVGRKYDELKVFSYDWSTNVITIISSGTTDLGYFKGFGINRGSKKCLYNKYNNPAYSSNFTITLVVYDLNSKTESSYATVSGKTKEPAFLHTGVKYGTAIFIKGTNYFFANGYFFSYSDDLNTITKLVEDNMNISDDFFLYYYYYGGKLTQNSFLVPGAWYNDGILYGRSLNYLYTLKLNPEYQIPVIPNCIAKFNKKVINGSTEIPANTSFTTSKTVITKEASISGTLTIPTGKVVS